MNLRPVIETAHRTVEVPRLFSCIFKHACTDTHSHTVKGSLAPGQGISAKDWSWTRELIASQAGQLQSGAREAPPCLPRSKASFSKALFAFCSLQQLNGTQKSLFLPFSPSTLFRFSLLLTLLLSDSRFNSCVLKEIMCLIGLLGVLFKWVLTHPHSLRLWILLWDGLSGTCFHTQSAGWAWNGNLGVCYSLILLSHSNYN